MFWVFLALPCALLIGTATIGVWRYSALPASLHFVFPGSLGQWTLATAPLNAFLPIIFQGICTLLLAGLAWLLNFGSQLIDTKLSY